jgi:hypothetical protein
MTDRDVQREIEENQRRARDEQDVGLEEDVLRQDDDDGTFLDDALDAIPGIGDDDASRKREVEHDDNNKGRFMPE